MILFCFLFRFLHVSNMFDSFREANNPLAITDMADSIVKFDEHEDGLARYTIYTYQNNTRGSGYD